MSGTNCAEVLLGLLRCNQETWVDSYIEAAQKMHIEDQLELTLRIALEADSSSKLAKRLGLNE